MKKYSKEALTPQKVLNLLDKGYHVFYKIQNREYELIKTIDGAKLFYCYNSNWCVKIDTFDFVLESFNQWQSVGIFKNSKFFYYE